MALENEPEMNHRQRQAVHTKRLEGDAQSARKHGVRLEAIHPSPEVREELPAIHSIQTKTHEKPDTLCNKFGKCLQNHHKVRTLHNITTLAENTPRDHKRNKKCKCTKCTRIRIDTAGSCKRPNKCIERVANLIGTINEKWNPTILHPPELLTHPEPEEVGPKYDPDSEETTHTLSAYRIEDSLKHCFRVFSTPTDPPTTRMRRANRTAAFNTPIMVVYTDGSCTKNGETTAQVGSGVWFGENDPRNISLRVPYATQSNQMGDT